MVKNTVEVKQLNREKIVKVMQKRERCTKAEVASETALSLATCGTILNEMAAAGEVVKLDQENPLVGRPATVFAYNKDYRHVLGLYIKPENEGYVAKCAVADGLGHIREDEVICTQEMTCEVIEKIISSYLLRDRSISGVGIGIPGVSDHGVIDYCDIKALENVDLGSYLAARFPADFYIENDINAVAYHLYRENRDYKSNLAAVYFPGRDGGYVGSGYIVEGNMLRGDTMLSGELHYVARAFGLSDERQHELLQDAAAFPQYVAQILTVVICTVNPATVILMGDAIDGQVTAQAKRICEDLMSARHVPRLVINNDIGRNCIQGVIDYALDKIQFPLMKLSE